MLFRSVHKLRHGDFKKYQNIVLVDTQPEFENNPFPKNRKLMLVIDQHASLRRPNAELSIVDTECGATCVILARALLMLKKEVPSRIATALAYGIVTDTLNLYRAPHMHVIETYLDVLPFSDMRALAKIQNPTRSRRFFSTLGRGIQNAMAKRRLVISHLGSVENPDLVSQVTEFLLTYKGARYACCTGRFRGKMHVSLRIATPGADAGEILRDVFSSRGEAGGHGSIAGGSFEVGDAVESEIWSQIEAGLAENLSRRLRIPKKIEFYYPFRKKE